MKRLGTTAMLMVLLGGAAAGREWTSADGKFHVEAKLVEFDGTQVQLQRADGRTITVPLEKLSPADQRWLRTQRPSAKPSSSAGGAGLSLEPRPKPGPKPKGPVAGGITEDLGRQTVPMESVALAPNTVRRADPVTLYLHMMALPQRFVMSPGQGRAAYEVQFQQIVAKEPTYESATPFRGVLKLCCGPRAFALDAVGRDVLGYNRLYFDADGDADLAAETPIEASSIEPVGKTQVTSYFPPVSVAGEVDGAKIEPVFLLEAQCLLLRSPVVMVSVQPGSVRQGQIAVGTRKIKLVLVDRNCNGRFDDRVTVRKAGSRLAVGEGDLLLVDPDFRSLRAANATTGRDRYYVGRTIGLGRRFYKLDVSPGGERVALAPCELALGYVTNPSPAYRAVVYSDEHGAVMIGGLGGQKIPLPEGAWRVAENTIDAAGSLGSSWGAMMSASFSGDAPAFEVSKDKTTELVFGPPFRPVVTLSRSPMEEGKLFLQLVVEGAGGERCTSFQVNGAKPPGPRFEVLDSAGKVVYQNQFEYG